MSLIGLDVGTTGCKAVGFDEQGRELAQAYREYPLLHPQPGWSELSTTTIWSAVQEVLARVARTIGTSDPPQAISVSCQGEAVAPIAPDGQALYNFSVSFDDRTITQYHWWLEHVGKEKIFQITGMPLHPMHSINKIMWFQEHRPEIFAKTWKFLCVEDYIIFQLSGELAIDYSLAARTMAFDIRALTWSADMLRAARIDPEVLPVPYPSGTAVGVIRPTLAQELCLPTHTQIVTGGHDQPCGALGAGVIKEGLALNATGTSDVLCPAMREPILTPKMLAHNYSCYPHTFRDYYCCIGFNLTGGLLLRWYRDVLCVGECAEARQRGCDPYQVIIENAAAEIARPLFLPHFVGSGTPTLDPISRGALVNLTIDVEKAELNRAVLDSLNYEMHYNIEAMEDAGIPIETIRAIGGGAKSERWLQLKADVFGKPVELLEVTEAAALGAAFLAGQAIGTYTEIANDIQHIVRPKKCFEPNQQQHGRYADQYAAYKKFTLHCVSLTIR